MGIFLYRSGVFDWLMESRKALNKNRLTYINCGVIKKLFMVKHYKNSLKVSKQKQKRWHERILKKLFTST